MVRYRRNFVSGGTFFFTVTLLDRRSRVLVERIAALRTAFSRGSQGKAIHDRCCRYSPRPPACRHDLAAR
jgi:REP element-mobilizing transposase RayT